MTNDESVPSNTFLVSLAQADWDKDLKGWRCDVLRLDAVTLVAVYVQGVKQSDDHYILSGDVLRWRHTTSPTSLKIQVRIRQAQSADGAKDAASDQALTSARDDAIAQRDKAIAAHAATQEELAKLRLAHNSLELEKKFNLRHIVITSAFTLVATVVPFAFAYASKTSTPPGTASAAVSGTVRPPTCETATTVAASCPPLKIDPAPAVACRTSYLRLKTAGREASLGLADLRTSIAQHATACDAPLREFVDLASRGSSPATTPAAAPGEGP